MALIDSEAGEIVIRVVYDGPPEAGKTTSLRALAGSLAQPTYTPAEDAGGRTLWFDWMEYVGGRFEGCRIRCQIVGVPGQRTLTARRRRIIEGADVVVFVGDSSAGELPQTLAYLFELRDMLAHHADVPVGVILQANKRDLAGAIPVDELRDQLARAGWPIGVVESVAADGTGIREAFVYAVRLALDRVRELMNRRAMLGEASGAQTAGELLDALRVGEHAADLAAPLVMESGPGSLASALLGEVLAYEREAPRAERSVARMRISGAPNPPDAAVPSGAIWPPVEGRAILCELAQIELTPRRLPGGDWAAGLGSGWRVVSSRDATFGSLDQGRSALIQWARLHAGANGAVSPNRCIVLADSGVRAWRLWQIVRAEGSLRDAVEHALREHARELLIARLCQIAKLLIEADERLARVPLALPCNLDTIGSFDGVAVYIGLMPDAGTPPAEPRARDDPHALVRRVLEPALAPELHARKLAFEDILPRLLGVPHARTIDPSFDPSFAPGLHG
jgi:signal recognition particle receptor subunit beta